MKKQKTSKTILVIIVIVLLLTTAAVLGLYMENSKKDIPVSNTPWTPSQKLLIDLQKESPLPFSQLEETTVKYRFDINTITELKGYRIIATGKESDARNFNWGIGDIREKFINMGFTPSLNNEASGAGSGRTGLQKASTVCIIQDETPNFNKEEGCPNTQDYSDPGTCEYKTEIACAEL